MRLLDLLYWLFLVGGALLALAFPVAGGIVMALAIPLAFAETDSHDRLRLVMIALLALCLLAIFGFGASGWLPWTCAAVFLFLAATARLR